MSVDIKQAKANIAHYLDNTPLISSTTLNHLLGHNIYFKIDALQKTGAYKVRGVLNHILNLKAKNQLPKKIVCYSTGNHGIGVSWVAQQLNLEARVYLPKYTARVKYNAIKFYGSEVIETESRIDAEIMSKKDVKHGYYFLHPSDSDTTIAGAGTLCYEALLEIQSKPDAIFASIGGGGLISGTLIARNLLSPSSLVFGVEPSIADDAYISKRDGKIFAFEHSPKTIADGLKTLRISDRTFEYIKKIDGIYRVEEELICYYTAWLIHLLKVTVEPSCAINLAGAVEWLRYQKDRKNILILISGGNIDPSLYKILYDSNYLDFPPSLAK
jgi:threonine dehydratase